MNYEEFLEKAATSIQETWAEHKVGILSTIVFHLLFLVILLASKLETSKEFYGSEIEVEFEDEVIEEDIPEPEARLLPADALVPEYETQAIRNFAVDASDKDLNSNLSDEKNIDANELYNEAQRLKQQMNENKDFYEDSQDLENEIPNTPEKEVPEDKKTKIEGPTVVSYYLEGRKARHLPVPAYKCELGGQVVVNIEVAQNGRVSNATIDRSHSVIDDCINRAAIDAALSSNFTASQSNSKQKGSITYLFVAQ